MSKLQTIRLKQHLSQQELSERSGISLRTIQRIEAGTPAKGFSLKALAKALDIPEAQLEEPETIPQRENSTWLKLINLSALPLMFLPPLNIAVPLLIMSYRKQFSSTAKRLLTLQVLWTIIAGILILTVIVLNDVFGIKGPAMMLLPTFWLLVNAIVIFANAARLSSRGTLFFDPKFSLF